MARIRSIHPGLATDEAFMEMSMPAKAAWPLLWTQCDDQGAFEWKPKTLKAAIFPGETVQFDTILSEFERLNCVKRIEIDGREIGLVRNFCKYQSPKKPSCRFVIPAEFRTYVALKPLSSEPGDDIAPPSSVPPPSQAPPVPHRFPTGTEIAGQREKEREKEREGKSQTTQPYDPREGNAGLRLARLEFWLRDAAGWQNETSPRLAVTGPIDALAQAGVSPELDIFPTVRAKAGEAHSRKSWDFFVDPIKRAYAKRTEAGSIAVNGAAPDAEAKKLAAQKLLEKHTATYLAGQANGDTGRH